jgi:hypothetical protein
VSEVGELGVQALLAPFLYAADAFEDLLEVVEIVQVPFSKTLNKVLHFHLSMVLVFLHKAIGTSQPVLLALRIQTNKHQPRILMPGHPALALHCFDFQYTQGLL